MERKLSYAELILLTIVSTHLYFSMIVIAWGVIPFSYSQIRCRTIDFFFFSIFNISFKVGAYIFILLKSM